MNFDADLVNRICDDLRFPDQEMYTVHWIGGSSGAFLRSLVELYFFDRNFKNKLSSYNNSHDTIDPNRMNWHPNSYKDVPGGYYSWMPPQHKYIRPLDYKRPVFMVDHVPADFTTLWNRWPKAKVLIVGLRQEDQLEVMFNIHWKGFVQYYGDDETVSRWELMKEQYPNLFEKYNHPADITVDDLKNYFFDYKTDFDNYTSLPKFDMDDFYNIHKPFPDEFKDKVLKVPYYHLVRNPEYTMKLLSNFLGKPTSDNIKEFYYTYIERQNKLIQDRAPWLREYGRLWNAPLEEK